MQANVDNRTSNSAFYRARKRRSWMFFVVLFGYAAIMFIISMVILNQNTDESMERAKTENPQAYEQIQERNAIIGQEEQSRANSR